MSATDLKKLYEEIWTEEARKRFDQSLMSLPAFDELHMQTPKPTISMAEIPTASQLATSHHERVKDMARAISSNASVMPSRRYGNNELKHLTEAMINTANTIREATADAVIMDEVSSITGEDWNRIKHISEIANNSTMASERFAQELSDLRAALGIADPKVESEPEDESDYSDNPLYGAF